ncbi:MAG TPA: 50S ribosomal protein L29 [Dehalococcoidia bacterium]|jgi:large subunit ribosomal protein L29|nr:50S ribosomal protein L29 [Dehalococcoidia bacterium]|tara:strand:- start:45 stop:272 length:228 start_codon:yes stop_codon:yes gene_type:complete
MKISEIRELNQEDLLNQLEESRKQYFNLRFSKASMQLSDSSQIKKVKKDISRILTVKKERELLSLNPNLVEEGEN